MTIHDKFSLTDKVALVTGGAGLLGTEFCRTLAEAGATVYLSDQNPELIDRAISTLKGLAGKVSGVVINVTDPQSIHAEVEKIIAETNRLDVLVNSAALDPKFDPSHPRYYNNAFEDYPLEFWRDGLDVNLTGPFLVSQAVSKQMVKQNSGSIINLCSTYGLVGPDQRVYENTGKHKTFKPVFYSVTKAGILGLTRYLAAYYAGTNIRVNALTPGGVENGHEEQFVKNYSSRAVLGRMAKKDEMNGALLFLASEASSYMTGANLVVDGGWTAW
ncbi:MAG: putative oxidoreductase [Chloroflexi bacterium]|nr:MAG: putative oxidoreductase [Chloroflexota bacterium]MBA4375094.1 short-chain dehydrogenase [Anaerolinea sp.]